MDFDRSDVKPRQYVIETKRKFDNFTTHHKKKTFMFHAFFYDRKLKTKAVRSMARVYTNNHMWLNIK